MVLKIVGAALLLNIALLVAVDEVFHDDTFEPMRWKKKLWIIIVLFSYLLKNFLPFEDEKVVDKVADLVVDMEKIMVALVLLLMAHLQKNDFLNL